MAETYPSGQPGPGERRNPSVESTRRDDEQVRRTHENEEALGAAAAAGLGCLGITLAPWLIAGLGIVAAMALIFIVKSCGK